MSRGAQREPSDAGGTGQEISQRMGLLLTLVLLGAGLVMVVRVGPPEGDLYNYLAAAHAWLTVGENAQLVSLTDYRWLGDMAAQAGLGPRLVGFTIITPPSLLVGVPLVLMGAAYAAKVWQVVQAAALGLMALASARAVSRPLWFGLLSLFLIGGAVRSHLWQGQLHVLAAFALSVAGWAWWKQRPVWAGVGLGLAIGIKVHAWPVLILLAMWRQWRAVITTCVVLLVGGGVSIALLGWPVHQVWLAEAVPAGAGGFFIDPWHPSFQSLGHGLRRWLVAHPTLNSTAMVNAPAVAGGLAGAVHGFVVGVSLGVAGIPERRSLSRAAPGSLGLLGLVSVAALLSGPILSGYHLVLLAPAVCWSMDGWWRRGHPRRACLVGLLAMLAASVPPMPELPALLSVPRAWLALALWATMVPWTRFGRGTLWMGVLLCALAGLSGAQRAAVWHGNPDGATALEHRSAPLIVAELTQTADGVLWMSAVAPSPDDSVHRWVGVRWNPDDDSGPSVVASDPAAHVWSPRVADHGGVAWATGATEMMESEGCRFADGRRVVVTRRGATAELELVDEAGARSWLTDHPAHDVSPVCDEGRQRVWFLSDRGVGSRALRIWWIAAPAA